MAKARMKLKGAALKFFKKVGAKGGRKRAAKYTRKQLSEWAQQGGRPQGT